MLVLFLIVVSVNAWHVLRGPTDAVAGAATAGIRAVIAYFSRYDGADWLWLGASTSICLAAFRAWRGKARAPRVLLRLGVVCAVALSLALPTVVALDRYGFAHERHALVASLRRERQRWIAHYDRRGDPDGRESIRHAITGTARSVANTQPNPTGYGRLRIARNWLDHWRRERHALGATHEW